MLTLSSHEFKAATTSTPIIIQSLWEEINTQYLYDIASNAVRTDSIPSGLILNADQALSNYVPAINVTVAEQGTVHIPIRVGDEKNAITITVIQILSGKMLPFQIIYTGKTDRCLLKNATGKKKSCFCIMKRIGVRK